MAYRHRNLTIVQKMLAAPLVAVLLYIIYLGYLYGEHKQSSATIAAIRDSYLPVLDLANENQILFGTIADTFKDAVLAGERDWLENTRRDQARVEHNLQRLDSFPVLVTKRRAPPLRSAFQSYYANALALSLAMLRQPQSSEPLDPLIENVERFHAQVEQGFARFKSDLQQQFSDQIERGNRRSQQLVLFGVGLGAALIVVVVGVTLAVSLSTRRSLAEVNDALRNIAQDNPDFSARLQRSHNDELGEMVGWFNQLADKLEQDYKKIERLSITDPLTQLYNRAKIDVLFQMELNKVKRYGAPLSVILLDIDHFKQVNDTHGHLMGDRVLRELADLLRQCVRDTDHIGRWGGEEFIILATNTALPEAERLAEKLRVVVARHRFGEVGHKTASFGIAAYQANEIADTLTKRADDCLYLAKRHGRNRVVTQAAMTEHART